MQLCLHVGVNCMMVVTETDVHSYIYNMV